MLRPLSGLAASLILLAAALPHAARADDGKSCKLAGLGTLKVLMEGPRASIPVKINGSETRLWLDSGAFFNFMSAAQAAEFKLPKEPLPDGFFVTGIGGSYVPSLATVSDFELAGAKLHKMQFVVGGSDAGNGFLGANLLGVFDTEFDLAKGAVRLFHAKGCQGANLAYWGAGMAVGQIRKTSPGEDHDYHIYGEVMVNGHRLTAMFDTGAPDSALNLEGARKAGIDLKAPGVISSEKVGGVGKQLRRTWIVRMQSIDLGGETIQNSPIRVIDDDSAGLSHEDMIIGMDFFLSHHVLVSPSTNTIFLTYNGGPIFSASSDGAMGNAPIRTENMGASEATAAPKTADEFAGRGSARLSKDDYAGAIADLGEAIRLDPKNTHILADRAKAYAHNGQWDLAMTDIDRALVLSPRDPDLLLQRGYDRLRRGDKPGAQADADAAVAAAPAGSLVLLGTIGLYQRLGKLDQALGVIDSVIALHKEDSRYPQLLNDRAWNRALANTDLDRALADINLALRKRKDEAAFLDTRGLVLLRRKDFFGAIADTSAVLTKAPKAATSLYFRALAEMASGKKAAGEADLAAAREIAPHIDGRFGPFGLAAPNAPAPGKAGDEEDDDQ